MAADPGPDAVTDKRGISPSTSLRLAKFFGPSAGLGMNLQLRRDLFYAQRAERKASPEFRR